MKKFTHKTALTIASGLALTLLLGACSTHAEKKEAAVAKAISETAPIDRATALTRIMAERLGLSPMQVEKVGALNLQTARKMNLLVASKNPDINKQQEVYSILTEKEVAMRGLLNQAQYQQYLADRDNFIQNYKIL